MNDETKPLPIVAAPTPESTQVTLHEGTAPASTAPVGGPLHRHSVTAAGLLAIAAGIGLVVAAPHLAGQGSLATATGIGLIATGAGGTTFGKSPAIR